MDPGPPLPRIYRFGLFLFHTDGATLLYRGLPVSIHGQPLQVLALLLERHGELVGREQLCATLWPQGTYVAFEGSLNAIVKRLRAALRDSAENPVFIETVPKRGYRFIAPIELAADGGPAIGAAASPGAGGVRPRRLRPRLWAMVLLPGAAVAAALWLLVPAPAPQVVRVRQISGFGIESSKIVTDGARVYVSGHDDFDQPFRVFSVNGGEGVPFRVPLPRTEAIRNAAPDGSWLLVTTGRASPHPLWKVPLPAGSPQRLANIMGTDGAWSPDGKQIAYVDGSDLDLIASNGGAARKLASFHGSPAYPVWSPHGRRIRVMLQPDERDPSRSELLWEVTVATGASRPILAAYSSASTHPVGWTADGADFIFTSTQADVSYLWAAPERGNWLERAHRQPVRLTSGPISFPYPILSHSGNTVLAVGDQLRAELMRYDLKSHQFAPFLGGRPDDQVSFSRDGQWAAYVSFPDGALWRSRANGEDRLQLTFPPLRAYAPHWSPDDQEIVFWAVDAAGHMKGYLVPSGGGAPRPLLPHSGKRETDFNWMPDGTHLLYTELPTSPSAPPRVRVLDLQSGRSADEPGLLGVALVSPNGRYIAVQDWATKQLRVFDTRGRSWTQVAPSGDYPAWSADSKTLYFNTMNDFPLGPHSGLRRFSVTTHQVETMMPNPDFALTGVWGAWVGLAPDGSPLVLKSDIVRALYAIDLDLR